MRSTSNQYILRRISSGGTVRGLLQTSGNHSAESNASSVFHEFQQIQASQTLQEEVLVRFTLF